MRIYTLVFAIIFATSFAATAVDVTGAYPCINGCMDAGGDMAICVQSCVTPAQNEFDSDGDGMPNLFENRFDTNPNDMDALEDPDFDGLVNLEEFFLRSDPQDGNDPAPSFFVAPDGINLPQRGTREAPWRDIAYAISVLEPSLNLPVNIILKSGLYREDLILKPGIRLRSALFNRAIINGVIVGADGCALQNINITARRADDVLLTVDDVRMAILNVKFNGGFFRVGTGVWTDGAALFNTMIEGCTFENLQIGVDVNGAIPLIRRNNFEQLAQAAVYLRASSEAFAGRSLGTSDNAGSGWNFFSMDMDFMAVVNERSDAVPMENNDWDTDAPENESNRVDGPSDIEPFLATGNAVLAGAVYCSVWNAADEMPITDASVSLTPSGYNPTTENENGVYVFAAVPDGSYLVTVTHASFGTKSANALVQSGGIVTVNVPYGEAPPPNNPGCECNNPNQTKALQAGDALVVIVSLMLILAKRKSGKA